MNLNVLRSQNNFYDSSNEVNKTKLEGSKKIEDSNMSNKEANNTSGNARELKKAEENFKNEMGNIEIEKLRDKNQAKADFINQSGKYLSQAVNPVSSLISKLF